MEDILLEAIRFELECMATMKESLHEAKGVIKEHRAQEARLKAEEEKLEAYKADLPAKVITY